jgi:hypothetical protein
MLSVPLGVSAPGPCVRWSSSGRNDVSERAEEILRAKFGE